MEEIQNYLETTYETIKNYLIDKEIIINDEDPFTIKAKKYLIKYKRLIGLISLIILIIIPYYCFTGDDEDEDKNVQRGGVVSREEAMQHLQNQKASREAMQKAKEEMDKAEKKEQTRRKTPEERAKAKADAKEKKSQDLADKKQEQKDALGKKYDNFKDNLNYKGAKNAAYNVGAAAAGAFKDNADWFYGLLYSIAATVAIFMLVVPTLGFVIIGIMCFFLLKTKVKFLKGL